MIKVIFVCLGNICRSPSGEGVFKALVRDEGLEDEFFIDSAGTSAYHVGESADRRMQKAAARRNIQLTSRSRKFIADDLGEFDCIIAMDRQNRRDILQLDRQGNFEKKVFMMTDFSKNYRGQDVPDPYYGGADGFDVVLDLLDESCRGLLETLKEQNGLQSDS